MAPNSMPMSKATWPVIFFTSDRAKAVIKVITWCLSLLVCVLFVYHSGKYSIWLYHTGERTTGLWWPRIYSVGSMFFGAVFMLLYSIANVVKYTEVAIGSVDKNSGGAQ